MDNSNPVTGKYQSPGSSLSSTLWPASVTGPNTGLEFPGSTNTVNSEPSAQNFLQGDRISYSGMRLVANGLTPFQLYRLETLMQGQGGSSTPGIEAGQAALMQPDHIAANPQDGLQSHIAGQMANPIISKQYVRLPDNITSPQQTNAVENAVQATQRPGIGVVPLQETNAAVNSVLNKRPVQESQGGNSTESAVQGDSIFHSGNRSTYRDTLDAVAFAKPEGNSRDAQYLGVAVPVRQTKIMKKAQAPRSENQRPTFEIPPIPTAFVPLGRSIMSSSL